MHGTKEKMNKKIKEVGPEDRPQSGEFPTVEVQNFLLSEYEIDNPPKIYCPSMWKSVHVDVDSYLTPCCVFINTEDKKTKITDLSDNESIESVLKGEFQEYRDLMQEGKWPTGCHQCKFAEDEGRASKRLQDMQWGNARDNEGNLLFLSPPTDVNLEYLQLKTGRLCNLECTICTPACSTSIATAKLKSGEITREQYNKLNQEIKWATDLDQLKKMNSEFFRIDIAGGEPLMNHTHFEWLDQLPEESKKRTQLLYNTNGTHRPTEEQIDIWSKFKGVWITFSIDSYEKKFEMLRVNAIWDEVYANMKWFADYVVKDRLKHQSEMGFTNTAIVMTIHKGNINDIFKLYEKTKDIGWVQTDYINYNYLYYPESMAVHNMSKELLERATDNFNKNIRTLPKGKMKQEARNLRDSMVTFLGDKKYTSERPLQKDHREQINLEDITTLG